MSLEEKRYAIELGRRMRACRKSASVKQWQLADAATLNQAHLSSLENGKHGATLWVLSKLARGAGSIFGIPFVS